MVGAGKWISALGIGLVWGTIAMPAQAQVVSASAELLPWTFSTQRDAKHETRQQADDEEPRATTESFAPRQPEATDESEAAATETIKERYPNGAVKIERQVAQDAEGNYFNHGSWKMWDPSGRLTAEGQYEHGRRTGTWNRWYRGAEIAAVPMLSQAPYSHFAGPIVSQATFRDGKLDGTWTIYGDKMQKISQWHFFAGKRSGNSLWWWPNGHKMREVQFYDGDVDGTAVEWNLDGKVVSNEKFDAGRKLGLKVARYPNGAKKSEAMYLFARQAVRSPDDWWNCKPLSTVRQGNDERHGDWTSWHENGQRQLEGTYDHGVQVGTFVWWHSNGQIALKGRYEDGKQEGAWTWWHANGQKSIHGQYAHGSPVGRWTWWNENGRVAQSADLSGTDGVVIDTQHGDDILPSPSARAVRSGSARR